MFSFNKSILRRNSLHAAAILIATLFTGNSLAQDQQAKASGSLIDVKIELTGLQSTDGKLVVVAYTENSWLGESEFTASAEISADSKGMPLEKQYVVLSLPEGSYGFSAYQDENSNGKLDMRLVFPAEPAGFSNKHRPRFGPPSFKKAKLYISKNSEPIGIELR